MEKYLIVGNGVAGTSAAEQIRSHDKNASVTIVTREVLPFYSRIRLPEYIAKKVKQTELIIKKEQWYKDHCIDLYLDSDIVKADQKNKILYDHTGRKYNYDRLLVATGSLSFLPPVKGMDKKNVFSLRTINDAKNILSQTEKCEHIMLIGGGLLGLEAGNAVRQHGKTITIVEFFPRLLHRQLDVPGAKILQDIMEQMEFTFCLGVKTEEIAGDTHVESVVLEGGQNLPCQMVIVSAGVRPDLELAKMLDLETDKGIKVNEKMETSLDGVYAAGDAIEFNGMLSGIWPAASDQGIIAGRNMAGNAAVYHGTTMSNKLKVAGIDLASAGNIDAENEMEAKTVTKEKIYKKLIFAGNTIIGCIMLGDTRGFNQIVKAINAKKDVSELKENILTDNFDFNLI